MHLHFNSESCWWARCRRRPAGVALAVRHGPGDADAGSRYLHVVGPFYGLFGLGMALYFASQGAGRLSWPLLANQIRFVIAAGGGWLVLRWSGDVSYVFVALGAALATFGLLNAVAVASGAWFGPIARPRPRLLVREGDQWK